MRSALIPCVLPILAILATPRASAAQAVPPPPVRERQSLDDAWWTGPMLAPSGSTLPRGHFLIEPYLYDVRAAGSNGYGSLTYALYGVTDRVTAGLIPTFGFNDVRDGPSSSGLKVGDVSALAQFRLTQSHAGSWIPTTSVVVQETFPTGKYDRLGERTSDGFGSGAYTTMLALYAQTYFWMPNGRILRMRMDVSQSFSSDVAVQDVSVYGTGAGFRGRAKPGSSFLVDAAWEYSLTRSWVLALDVTYRHGASTRVSGYAMPDGAQNPVDVLLISGSSDAFGFAPAIEYSWKPTIGVLFGTRVIPAGRNTTASITPAVAINIVR